jgi:hypothetical protein
VAAPPTRAEREAAALRENLRRRKQQARARADAPPARPTGTGEADGSVGRGERLP